MDNRNAIMRSLHEFVRQGPGIRRQDYGAEQQQYAAAVRKASRDLQSALLMLNYTEIAQISADTLLRAMASAYSGRMSWSLHTGIRYVPGRYWPTEFREAACAVLAAAIRWHWAADRTVRHDPVRTFGRYIAKRFFKD